MLNLEREVKAKKEKIEKAMKKEIERLEKLQSVKRLYKKDGKPFKTLSKNFAGLHFENRQYEWNKGFIDIFLYDSKYNKIFIWPSYTKRGESWTRESDPADVEKALKYAIESVKENIDDYKKALTVYDTIVNEFTTKIVIAINETIEREKELNGGDETHTILHACYEIMDNIKYSDIRY